MSNWHPRSNTLNLTFGVEGDEAVTKRPIVHRLVEDNFLLKSDNCDVLEQAQALQDLLHGFRLGLLGHSTNANHNLSLWGLGQREPHYHFWERGWLTSRQVLGDSTYS